ncbi:MAG: hypothetical protein V3R99_13910 [Thermoguttaceae bacterium]
MRVNLRKCAAMIVLAAVVTVGTQTAKADQKVGLRGVQVSWDGRGEMQYLLNDDGEPTFAIQLTGNVVARGKHFEATADRLMFDSREGLLRLESEADGEVRLFYRMPGDGPRAELTARKIDIRLSDSRIEVEGAGNLKTIEKER